MANFEKFKEVILCKDANATPVAEIVIDNEIKERFIDRKIENLSDDIFFWRSAGYDFIPISSGILQPAKTLGGHEGEKWAEEDIGQITNFEDLEKYPWPRAEELDYSIFDEARFLIPDGMKVIGLNGKIFTISWMLMGWMGFSYAIYDNPTLIRELFERVGEIQFKSFCKVANMDSVGAMWVIDDIAYSESLLVSPNFLRNHLFPWLRKMVGYANEKGKPVIYHSDGMLYDVLDDIIGMGFNALHPVEPKSMDLSILKKKYGKKLCFIGRVDLDRFI